MLAMRSSVIELFEHMFVASDSQQKIKMITVMDIQKIEQLKTEAQAIGAVIKKWLKQHG